MAHIATENHTSTPADTPPGKLVFDALTGLRAVAAFLVFLHHTSVPGLPQALHAIQAELHIGVPIFFVLSGFLISYRYFNNITYSRSWFATYFQNRFARIFPVYFVVCIGAFVFGAYHGIGNALLNVSLLHGFFSDTERAVEQSWSLTVEECFYFSAPFIFYFGRKTLLGPWLFFLALLFVALNINSGLSLESSFLQGDRFVLIYTFFGRFTEFFCGIALGKLILAQHHKLSNKKTDIRFTLLGCAGIMACCMALVVLKTPEYNTGLKTPFGIVVNNLLFPCFVVSLLFGLIYEASALRSILSTRLAILLGKSSYVLYLIHRGYIYEIIADHTFGIPGAYFINFILIYGISILMYLLIEHPLNEWIRKIKWRTTLPGRWLLLPLSKRSK